MKTVLLILLKSICGLLIMFNPRLWGMEMSLGYENRNYKDVLSRDEEYQKLEQFIIDQAHEHEISNDDRISAVALSPDGTQLAMGDNEKMTLKSVATGKLLREVSYNTKVLSLAWSKDNKKFAMGSSDKKARLICAVTGKLLLDLEHSDPVLAVALSCDSRKLATGSFHKAKLFDTTTGNPLLEVSHAYPVFSVAFSPNGERLATGSSVEAKISCAVTGSSLFRLWHCDEVRAVAFSPDGKKLATESGDGIAKLYCATTGEYLGPQMHRMHAWFRALSPDGKQLAGLSEKKVKIYKLTVLEQIQDLFANPTVTQVKWLDAFDLAIADARCIEPTLNQWQQCQEIFPEVFRRALSSYIKEPEKND